MRVTTTPVHRIVPSESRNSANKAELASALLRTGLHGDDIRRDPAAAYAKLRAVTGWPAIDEEVDDLAAFADSVWSKAPATPRPSPTRDASFVRAIGYTALAWLTWRVFWPKRNG